MIASKPKPKAEPAQPSTSPEEKTAREDAFIAQGGGPAKRQEEPAADLSGQKYLMSDEQKRAKEYLQLRPPTWKVLQIDAVREAQRKKDGKKKKTPRLTWIMDLIDAAIQAKVKELDIEFGPNATEPPEEEELVRRVRE